MANRLSKTLIKDETSEPVRLNKYLSDAGICSRREADRLIAAGQVVVDGNVAVMGQKVSPGQKIICNGKETKSSDDLVLLAFYKPVGIECTTAQNNKDNIIDYIKYPTRIFPIGRLDKNSSGLILLTNTGEISDRILRGSNYHEKEYQVTVDKPLTMDFIRHMQDGVEIELEDGRRRVTTRRCQVEATGKCSFNITLTQGLNRQIRRMCQTLGYNVLTLKRIRIMNINLGNLSEGHYRNVSESEIRKLMKDLNKNQLADKEDEI